MSGIQCTTASDNAIIQDQNQNKVKINTKPTHILLQQKIKQNTQANDLLRE